MRYALGRVQRASQMVNIICATLFLLFCFSYLAFFQLDFISFAQRYYSAGRNVHHGFVFPVVITVVLWLLGVALQHFVHLPIRLRALHWVPSTLILTVVGSFRIGRFTDPADTAGWLTYAIVILLFVGIYYVGLLIHEDRSENTSLFVLGWPNLLIMSLLFAFVARSSNTNENLHSELAIERAVGNGEWDKALEIIDQRGAGHQTRFMTAMAAYSLYQQGKLGECFFRYATSEGSDAFLPIPADSIRPWNPVLLYRELLGGFPATDMNAATYLEFLKRDTLATTHVDDFLLTAYLADGQVDRFAETLMAVHAPLDSLSHTYSLQDSLPCNFREALVQYSFTAEHPHTMLQDSLLMSQYTVFDSLSQVVSVPSQQWEDFKREYHGSYWYYYRFVRKVNR